MGIWSSLKSGLSKGYKKLDTSAKGYLPGGVTPKEFKKAQEPKLVKSSEPITYTKAAKQYERITETKPSTSKKTISYTKAVKQYEKVSKPKEKPIIIKEPVIPTTATKIDYRLPEPPPKVEAQPLMIGPTPFWEQRYPSQVKGAVKELGAAFGQLTSLGGRLDYKPTKTQHYAQPTFPTEPIGTGGKGTAIFVKPTEEQMTPEQRIQSKVDTAGIKAHIKSKGVSEKLADKYQTQINKGEISVEKAQVEYEKEYIKDTSKIRKDFSKTLKEAEYKYGSEVRIQSLPLTAGKMAIFGGIGAIAPPVALGMGGLNIATTAFDYSRPGGLKEEMTLYPKETLSHIGVGIVAAGVGGWGTNIAWGKVKGFARTFGKTRRTPEQTFSPSILAGKKEFPTAPTKYHLEIFKQQKYKLPKEMKPGVWHATTAKFTKEISVRPGKLRPGQPKGLYVAPSVSAHFLRTTTSPKLIGWNMKSIFEQGSPSIYRIIPKSIKVGTKGRLGVAELPLFSPEIQAVLPLSTRLVQTGAKYYTTYGGQRIPIFQYKVIGPGGFVKGMTTTFGKLSSYKYSPSRVSLITPQSLGYSLGISKSYTSGISKSFSKSIIYFKQPSYVSYKQPTYVSKKYTQPKYKSTIYSLSASKLYPKSSFVSVVSKISKSYPTKIYPSVKPQKIMYPIKKGKGLVPQIPKTLLDKRPKERIIKQRRPKGFNVYGKPIRQKRYIKLNKVPLTKTQAQSMGMYLADTSLSRTFKIKKTSKKPQPPKLMFPQNYALFNRPKFRGHRIIKGKRVPLKNKWIERTPHLIDTRQEVRKITLARRIAQMRKQQNQRGAYQRQIQKAFSLSLKPIKKKKRKRK